MKCLALILGASLAGCLHSPPVEYSQPVRVDSAELIPINPDVKVVADSEKPMFFVRGSYWLFHDAAWYRSQTIHGAWVKDRTPPVPVLQIDQPYAFTNYRDDHPADRTAAVEVDNTQIPNNGQPDFKFKENAMGFE